ncbi:MAG: SDR family NAD(P)-dependent oxidoreductase, partial [Actinobacteria bacterium]|nr:SDR family NAD(P)-dependent oxidoreductase [Actinomycetota bacterium]MBU1944049.1 SDR family NAD(P)-dependent oxidoreductase [Actinomycetota bacterium]MBU2688544.1 SDR family NAD(P)-dependent oxidoreductase [Actinomycetota bacterium]
MDFTGKSIIITGSGGGIGRRTALEMASRGGLLTICDIDPGRAEAVAGEITAAGGSAIAIQCDVTDYEQAKKVVE